MRKKLLIVVDMQNDFIYGSLGNEDCQKTVPVIKEIIEKWDGDIVFTRDTHGSCEEYFNSLEGKKLPVHHSEKGSRGWEIVDELKDFLPNPKKEEVEDFDYICENGNMIIDKPVFGSVKLGKLAEKKKYSEYLMVGVCTGICVISNAVIIRSFDVNADIKVIVDACACVNSDTHKTALDAMKTLQIEIIKEYKWKRLKNENG